jgi:hypothetical protein
VPSPARRSTQAPAPSQVSAASQAGPVASPHGVPAGRSFGAQKPSASQVSGAEQALACSPHALPTPME